ncbi:MAG: 6-phosphogluconolactonase [Bacteroidota bacterium]
MKKEIHVAGDPKGTAEQFIDFLKDFCAGKERVTIALSGGSTPKLLFDLLAAAPKTLDWSKLHFFWGDERCVPPDHEESNYKMTFDHLLSHIDMPAENIHRVRGEADPVTEADRSGKELLAFCTVVNDLPSIDLNILGMGDDGHTASIFPHQMELLAAEQLCAVATHPTSDQKRVTLTGPVINNSHTVAFLVTGEKKAQKIRSILGEEADASDYPASHVSPRAELRWFLDQGAYALVER